MNLDPKILKKILPTVKQAGYRFIPYLIQTCNEYEINTQSRICCFLSQLFHESGSLFYVEELASGKAYEGREDLGNTHKGDGVKYKGRGLIQITGRSNYTNLSLSFKQDFINNPGLLENPEWATRSAGWFWNSKDLNFNSDLIKIDKPIEDKSNMSVYKTITKKINGGYNGLDDRIHHFKNIQKYISEII